MAYHHHLGTVVESQRDLNRFLQATGRSVGLTLDTGHAALGGIDALALIRDHPQRVAHVHCKDIRGRVFSRVKSENQSFLSGVISGMFTVPGDGDLEFAGVMQALAKIGYAAWVIVEAEQDPGVANPKSYASLGLEDSAPRGFGRQFARDGAFMSKLLIQSGTPDADGCVINITPESAGWRHIGFQVHRLEGGQELRGGTEDRETCLVVLAGTADIVIDEAHFEGIGHRSSVFDDAAPGAVYAPAGRTYSVAARGRSGVGGVFGAGQGRDARLAPLPPPK